jgi:hypothetical protein
MFHPPVAFNRRRSGNLWARRGADKRPNASIRISIVIRLLRQQKFVVRVKNSVVPPRNEFYAQPVETALTSLPI